MARGFRVWPLALVLQITALASAGAEDERSLQQTFDLQVKPFLKQYCERCHNEEKRTSGVRVDHLDSLLEDRQLKLWEGARKQIASEAMPPEDEPQPSEIQRQGMNDWITRALAVARSRPTPKNGGARRLTVAQYRNTLRALLGIEDDLTDVLPPDAVSRDGFVNNQETLALSPLQIEAYLEIAEKALDRCLVDPNSRPLIQSFRVDLGTAINPDPCPDPLILGANSLLLDSGDFVVSQPKPFKTFDFEPFAMRAKYRFIEGYDGNNTVRGWRDYDSISHAVFACMRGSAGYPKGLPYSMVPQGLLLRPAITNDEIFDKEGTYGPKANFKISLRELPDEGRFRVSVVAAKYNDGLLLDRGAPAQPPESPDIILSRDPSTPRTVTIKKAGIYQVDMYPSPRETSGIAADPSRLAEGLIAAWSFDGDAASQPENKALTGRLEGTAKFVDSPFGKAVSLDQVGDAVVVPNHESMRVGEGDFTVAAWIYPEQLRPSGIVSLGKPGLTHGWSLDMPNGRGILRFETTGPNHQPNGSARSRPGAIRPNAWQHVAVVARRGKGSTRIYVNGVPVAKGTIGPANLDNPNLDLQIGRILDGNPLRGQLDEARLYRRALDEAEIQALLEPGRQFVPPPPLETPQEVTLTLGDRQFSANWQQPAFLAVRLDAGDLLVKAEQTGHAKLDRIALTPLAIDDDLANRFTAFERRSPRLGLHLGLRRDCGSTLAPVGTAQTVPNQSPSLFVFEGAIRNFPSPDVEKDNVNYLAGIREIGVRSEDTDGRDMPRLLIRSVAFEGPFYDAWPPESHTNLLIESDLKKDSPEYARRVIRDFASRAFRRPITTREESSLLAVFEESFQAGGGFPESVKDALQVVLTSPQFLFLIENSASPEPEPLDSYELASKLSYFLWNGPPDRGTLDLAAAGTLRDRLDLEVDRLIDDPRFSEFVGEFASGWLALDRFLVLEPDRDQFPKLTRDTRSQLTREPVQFLRYLIRENLPARNLIDSDFIVANEVVASYYDLGDRTESGFQFVAIPRERSELGGVLGQAAILAGLSDGRESNPVKRGAWLARRILADPPDDPPPNVPALKEETQRLSLRQRLERHRDAQGCAECHAKIDPWGIPLEEFDAGGLRKRQAVDARSTLPDKTEVDGFEALRRYLAEDRIDQVAFSVLKHLAIYATGRDLSHNELEFLKRDGVKLKANGYRLREMIHYVVNSPLFLEK